MKLGTLELQGQTVLAPMAGVTDWAFRCICQSLGAAVTVTEMVSSRALVYRDKKSMRLLRRTDGGVCGVQLGGLAEVSYTGTVPGVGNIGLTADGSGGVFTQESETWLNFLHQNGISWANWSLCDKNETSAALKPGTPTNRPWTGNDLTPSGKFVFSHF